MIKHIQLKNDATYKNVQNLNDLKKVNYFYGSNGVGKTSIGNILSDINNFPDSIIKWDNDEKEILIYNKQFVEKNFGENKKEHLGIFTLGKATKDELQIIEDLKDSITNLISNIALKQSTLDSKTLEKNSIEDTFKEKIWETKNSFDSDLKIAFNGFNSSKEKLKIEFLKNIQTNSNELLPLEKLKEQHAMLYATEIIELEEIDFSFINNLFIKESEIFSKPILGSEDLDISIFINKLNNADWIFKGIEYLDPKTTNCPFCQQNIDSEQLKNNLNRYFDTKYTFELNQIKDIEQNFLKNTLECYNKFEEVFLQLHKLKINKNDLKKIENQVIILKNKITLNTILIKEKINEPSRKIILNDIIENIEKIKEFGFNLNIKIKENNNIIKDLKKAKENYKKSVWKYFLECCKSTYEIYLCKVTPIEKAIIGIDKLKKSFTAKLPIEEENLRLATANLTSTKPTVDAINTLLREFGFKGFSLEECSTGRYQIIRENGDLANNTLSEGEKTFLTFLYFIHLIKGAHNKENINKEKVIVIDDPISSLDSTVLFIVSTLIKKIIVEISKNKGDIKQLLILTHNVYFHKEISFLKKIDKKYTKYFIVRKYDNNTIIEDCDTENKIQTSYQLLWNEVKNTNNNGIYLQNAMRRILENFFGFLGQHYDEQIILKFEKIEEQDVVRSLFSWVNDGSHCIQDDINLSCIDNTTIPYKEIFKNIFIKTGYTDHYNMMHQ
ncbi:MAG: AAA family ATPase [Fusobacteriaceae bacterium]